MSFTFESSKIRSLDISQLAGKAVIKVHDKNEIFIETTNEEKVEVERVGPTLEIKGKLEEDTNKKSKFSFGNIFGSNVVIQNNNIVSGNSITVINGKVVSGSTSGGKLPEVKMEIFVPKNTIKFLDISGVINVEVDSISENLDIDNSGQTRVNVSGIANLSVDTSGQSKIEANGVSKLNAGVSGQSKVDVHGTSFSEIEVDISGQSNLTIISDSIEELEADISGQSKLVVHGNIKQRNVHKSGLASFKNT
jgi:hypothetical protein